MSNGIVAAGVGCCIYVLSHYEMSAPTLAIGFALGYVAGRMINPILPMLRGLKR